MCLKIKRLSWCHVALHDIVCYKPVKYRRGNFTTREIITPVRGEPVAIGKTYKSKLDRQKITVERGLHSYANMNNAIAYSYGNPVVMCIIPIGSKYYKGTYNDMSSYASSELRYVKFVANHF